MHLQGFLLLNFIIQSYLFSEVYHNAHRSQYHHYMLAHNLEFKVTPMPLSLVNLWSLRRKYHQLILYLQCLHRWMLFCMIDEFSESETELLLYLLYIHVLTHRTFQIAWYKMIEQFSDEKVSWETRSYIFDKFVSKILEHNA